MKIAGISNIGLVRRSNQDNYLICQNAYGNTLALVADGIGGGKAGEIASLMASKNLGLAFSESEPFSTTASAKFWLEKTLKQINENIYKETLSNEDYAGMGTTLVVALFVNDEIVIANIGDSRAYILFDQKLIQITSDHSLVNDLVAKGQIQAADVENHPQRNVLTNALGVANTLKIDTFFVKKFDKLLLCSDGLSGFVKETDILNILNNQNYSIEKTLDELILAANNTGGYDNITAVVAEFGGFTNE